MAGLLDYLDMETMEQAPQQTRQNNQGGIPLGLLQGGLNMMMASQGGPGRNTRLGNVLAQGLGGFSQGVGNHAEWQQAQQMINQRNMLLNLQAQQQRQQMANTQEDRQRFDEWRNTLSPEEAAAYGAGTMGSNHLNRLDRNTQWDAEQDIRERTLQMQAANAAASRAAANAGKWEYDSKRGLLVNKSTGQIRPLTDAQGAALELNEPLDFNDTNALGKRFVSESEDFARMGTYFNDMIDLADKGTASSDTALIFRYMKMLDPRSQVTEGEQATASQAPGVPGAILSLYNSTVNGTRLGAQQRMEIIESAIPLYENALGQHDIRVKEYEGMADRFNMPREVVLRDYTSRPNTALSRYRTRGQNRTQGQGAATEQEPPVPDGYFWE